MALPKLSIALVGESFYLCGPKGNNVRAAATSGFNQIFEHRQSNIHHTFVALGENDSYYIRYYDERTGKTHSSYSLSAYPGLDSHLRKHNDGDPVCVSLGEDGSYFIRNDWGAAWNLPSSIEERVGLGDDNGDPIDYVFLGKDDAYLAITRNGTKRWNFRGNYGSLASELGHATSEVWCMGMNLQDDRSYFVLFKDGFTRYNAGKGQSSGRGLTSQDLRTWVSRL